MVSETVYTPELHQAAYLTPWKRFNSLDAGNQVQLLQNHLGALLQVHSVKVESTDVVRRRQDISAHLGNEPDPDLPDFFIVVLVRFQRVDVPLWDGRLTELRRPNKPVPSLNRGDSGDDWNRDTGFSHGSDPSEEDVNVVEHLSEDQGSAGVDFFFEPAHLGGEFCWRQVDVLRETGDGDFKVVVVLGTDVANEVDAVDETAFYGGPLVLSRWRVTTQGENVATPAPLCFLLSRYLGSEWNSESLTRSACHVLGERCPLFLSAY